MFTKLTNITIYELSKTINKGKIMKKILLTVCTIAALAHSYCEIGSRQTMYWNGGHQEAVYKFSNGQSFVLTCRDGYNSCPYTIRYDFWRGEFCH